MTSAALGGRRSRPGNDPGARVLGTPLEGSIAPKIRTSRRTTPMPGVLHGLLAARRERGEGLRHLMPGAEAEAAALLDRFLGA